MNWPFLPQNLVAGTKIWSLQLVPRIQTGFNSWSLRLDFEAKMASSHDATSPCDLLQGLVAVFRRLCAEYNVNCALWAKSVKIGVSVGFCYTH